ncbi:hypothetical protein CAPTEDRAFT_229152 [Capitella teleta]|uniref:Serine/threonine-protein phosphatase PGAM5, mitochondrial n=1 Tax=Capitella teleta TaxID=283909 RepID=R7UQG1_CAPTE|nr:hypothetical protein CAPTEDRAFT_229152 [Capitella teleta]|eukprot:ELU08430.1 hypothetical protein CAPTEDRAFT_229152 [Capitella teleta]
MQQGAPRMVSVRIVVVLGVVAVLCAVLTWMYTENKHCLIRQNEAKSRSENVLDLTEAKRLLGQQRELIQMQKVQIDKQMQSATGSESEKLLHRFLESKENEENTTQKPPWDYNWDQRAFANPQDAEKVADRVILLVRHGEYDFNTGLLTKRGQQQANMTGQRLRDLGMNYQRITHSTMDRARETAEIIRSHLPDIAIDTDTLLEEGGPVPPQPTVSYWHLPDQAYFKDGPRLEGAFRKYFYRAPAGQTRQTFEIIVAHANVIRFFVLRALQLPSHAWMRVFIAHASISLLHINSDGTVSMTRFGDSGHFPPEFVSV